LPLGAGIKTSKISQTRQTTKVGTKINCRQLSLALLNLLKCQVTLDLGNQEIWFKKDLIVEVYF
jgi:hypothetical protein